MIKFVLGVHLWIRHARYGEKGQTRGLGESRVILEVSLRFGAYFMSNEGVKKKAV